MNLSPDVAWYINVDIVSAEDFGGFLVGLISSLSSHVSPLREMFDALRIGLGVTPISGSGDPTWQVGIPKYY